MSLTRESTEDTGAGAAWHHRPVAIESLDLLYVPTRDAGADLRFYRDALGAKVVFAIEAMGTRVAELALGEGGPRLVLAEHLHGEAAVLLHRVGSLDEALAELSDRGLEPERRVELPLGPCATFRSPGGQRLGLYELTRPGVTEAWAGRADFG